MKQRALSPGAVVYKRYRIERVLGEGGFGVTYLVTDLRENKIAAMKEYMPVDLALRDPSSDMVYPRSGEEGNYERFRDKFEKEAQIIYQYQNQPNIIDVWHLFRANNTVYYVMEYIDGMDLKRKLECSGEKLPWNVLQSIFAQVISALREVHSHGMIHCDISTDNIFVPNYGQVKLIDFGAVKSVMNTKSSVILLKRGFAPPEQLSAQGKLGPWTDIYALAVTIYRAYTGQMPPAAEERLLQDRTLWPTELGLPLPSPKWEYALQKAMSLRISDRYQNVDEFWADLCGYSPRKTSILIGAGGYYENTRVELRERMYFGRDPGRSHFLYPGKTPGVSYHHCFLWEEDGIVYVVDEGSTYGTWIGSTCLEPGTAYPLYPGELLSIGSTTQTFYLVQQQSMYNQ